MNLDDLHAYFFDPFYPLNKDSSFKNKTVKSEQTKKERNRKLKIKPERVQCLICDKDLSKESLRFHLELHEKKKNETKFECEKCSKKFFTQRNLRQHQKIHTFSYTCDLCGNQFSRRQQLLNHKTLETCTDCKIEFKCRCQYMNHRRKNLE